MNTILDDTTHCPVCYQKYGESWKYVPHIMPCSHTICEGCSRKLRRQYIKTATVRCPQCRENHELDFCENFPENKYILKLMQTMEEHDQCIFEKRMLSNKFKSAEENVKKLKPKFELCPDHQRENFMYCTNPDCKRSVCAVCLFDEHRNHDVVDRQDDQTKKSQEVIFRIDTISEKVNITQEKVFSAKESLIEKYTCCAAEIKKAKSFEINRIEKRFDDLESENEQSRETVMTQINQRIDVIDGIAKQLNDIKSKTDETKTRNELELLNKEIDNIQLENDNLEKQIHKYFIYNKQDIPEEELKPLWGLLEPKTMCEENNEQPDNVSDESTQQVDLIAVSVEEGAEGVEDGAAGFFLPVGDKEA